MEKKDWRERLTSSYSYSMGESEYFVIDGEETNIDDLKDFIEQELDKAYDRGVNDGMRGKVFKKVEITEEAHIPEELLDKARQEGYERGLVENLDKRNSEGGLTVLESLILESLTLSKLKTKEDEK